MSDPNPSLESDEQNDFFPSSEFELGPELDGRTHLIDDSGHVSKLVHRFYFVKHWPTDPYSISLIKKERERDWENESGYSWNEWKDGRKNGMKEGQNLDAIF